LGEKKPKMELNELTYVVTLWFFNDEELQIRILRISSDLPG
jgi:hypothetical protein